MQITPITNEFNTEFETEEFANKTYKIDFKENRIIGKITDLEAVEQAIYKILHTERYSYLIYSWNYGVEFENLIGKDYEFILGDLQRRIEEALFQDDRIEKIDNLIIKKISKESILVSFIVVSKYGNLKTEVNVNV